MYKQSRTMQSAKNVGKGMPKRNVIAGTKIEKLPPQNAKTAVAGRSCKASEGEAGK